jgi:hypothetical protein
MYSKYQIPSIPIDMSQNQQGGAVKRNIEAVSCAFKTTKSCECSVMSRIGDSPTAF